jgi:cation:H+ antiporter
MLDLVLWIGIFVMALAVLIKASDYFTDSAEKIGIYFGLPAFIIGVTIVAVGTSLPELLSSIFAVLSDSSEIVVGNVIGSNIANIFLVLGVAAIIAKKLEVTYELVHVDLPMLIGSAFILAITIWDGVFTSLEAIICLLGLIIYVWYTIKVGKEHEATEKAVKKKKREEKKIFPWKELGIFLISMIFIFIGAKYTIESVINLSSILEIGKETIAITAVALGTSLPELVVSIQAARKGRAEMAVGNILGSNIFNSYAVMAIPAFVGTLVIPETILTFALPAMLIATLLYYFITQDRQITKWEGALLILFYVLFIGKVIGLL